MPRLTAVRNPKTRQSIREVQPVRRIGMRAVAPEQLDAVDREDQTDESGDAREQRGSPSATAGRCASGWRPSTCAPRPRGRASAARESSRLATLAQAISSTNPTAPISDASSGRIGPPMPLRNDARRCSKSLLVSGYCAASASTHAAKLGGRLLAGHARLRAVRTREGRARGDRSCPRRRPPRAAARGTSAAESRNRSGMTPMTIDARRSRESFGR